MAHQFCRRSYMHTRLFEVVRIGLTQGVDRDVMGTQDLGDVFLADWELF